MISFSVLASASYGFGFDYTNWTALQFTLTVGVFIWLFSWVLVAVAVIETCNNLDVNLSSNKTFQTSLRAANVVCIVFAYSAAIASASIGSDCNYNYYSSADDKITNAAESFCSKIQAGCAFMWFSLACLFAIFGSQYKLDHEESEAKYYGYTASEEDHSNSNPHSEEDKIAAGVDL